MLLFRHLPDLAQRIVLLMLLFIICGCGIYMSKSPFTLGLSGCLIIFLYPIKKHELNRKKFFLRLLVSIFFIYYVSFQFVSFQKETNYLAYNNPLNTTLDFLVFLFQLISLTVAIYLYYDYYIDTFIIESKCVCTSASCPTDDLLQENTTSNIQTDEK